LSQKKFIALAKEKQSNFHHSYPLKFQSLASVLAAVSDFANPRAFSCTWSHSPYEHWNTCKEIPSL